MEDEIREEFIVRGPVYSEMSPANNNEWEWYFLMQHFGAPTRLLDWTESALVALYFSVRENPGCYDAAVWVLDPYQMNRKAIGKEEIIAPSVIGLLGKDVKLVEPWLPTRFARKKLPRLPVAVYPAHIARRISTQRSCFTVHGENLDGFDGLRQGKKQCLVKIVVPAYAIPNIRKELLACGVDETTVFPNLDGLGKSLDMKWQVRDTALPHDGVHVRLRASDIHKGGVGVFAIRKIMKDTPLFPGDDEKIRYVEEKALPSNPQEIRKLYEDFAVIDQDRRYRCPQNFNDLTVAWYLNEPRKGEKANARCDPDSDYGFVAAEDIKAGDEITVNYGEYSELPPDDDKKRS